MRADVSPVTMLGLATDNAAMMGSWNRMKALTLVGCTTLTDSTHRPVLLPVYAYVDCS